MVGVDECILGLGAEAARVIFKHDPKLLILASRSKTTIDETITVIGAATALNVKAVEVDLADLDSVREAAAQILKLTTVVDVLINNAAIMSELHPSAAEGAAEWLCSASRIYENETWHREAVRHEPSRPLPPYESYHASSTAIPDRGRCGERLQCWSSGKPYSLRGHQF